ncbi:hypothetical protein ACWKWU_18695 [Chitinophaga lutea]
MKWSQLPMHGLLTAVLLAFAACKKNEHPHPGDCPTRTDCRVTSISNSVNEGEYYSVSFNSNGLPASINFRYLRSLYEMDIRYAGRNLTLTRRGTQDTLLFMRLDDCGRPLSGFSDLYLSETPRQYKFEYDIRGRLVKHSFQGQYAKDVQLYSYDHRGNVVAILPEEPYGQKQLFSYDYSQPVNNRQVVVGDAVGWTDFAVEVLKALDHIDLKPRNLPKSYENWTGDYRLTNLTFNDFEFDSEGRVVKYYSGDPNWPYTWWFAVNWGQCGGKPAK